jgi:paspaline synthase
VSRWYRFTGTLCAIFVFYWRYYFYPEDYWYIDTPATKFIFITAELAELAYPFVFWYVQKYEQREKLKGKKN